MTPATDRENTLSRSSVEIPSEKLPDEDRPAPLAELLLPGTTRSLQFPPVIRLCSRDLQVISRPVSQQAAHGLRGDETRWRPAAPLVPNSLAVGRQMDAPTVSTQMLQ